MSIVFCLLEMQSSSSLHLLFQDVSIHLSLSVLIPVVVPPPLLPGLFSPRQAGVFLLLLGQYMDVLIQVYTLGHMQHFEHQRKQGEY